MQASSSKNNTTNSGSIAMKAATGANVYSPTRHCSVFSRTGRIPCDAGPGADIIVY